MSRRFRGRPPRLALLVAAVGGAFAQPAVAAVRPTCARVPGVTLVQNQHWRVFQPKGQSWLVAWPAVCRVDSKRRLAALRVLRGAPDNAELTNLSLVGNWFVFDTFDVDGSYGHLVDLRTGRSRELARPYGGRGYQNYPISGVTDLVLPGGTLLTQERVFPAAGQPAQYSGVRVRDRSGARVIPAGATDPRAPFDATRSGGPSALAIAPGVDGAYVTDQAGIVQYIEGNGPAGGLALRPGSYKFVTRRLPNGKDRWHERVALQQGNSFAILRERRDAAELEIDEQTVGRNPRFARLVPGSRVQVVACGLSKVAPAIVLGRFADAPGGYRLRARDVATAAPALDLPVSKRTLDAGRALMVLSPQLASGEYRTYLAIAERSRIRLWENRYWHTKTWTELPSITADRAGRFAQAPGELFYTASDGVPRSYTFPA